MAVCLFSILHIQFFLVVVVVSRCGALFFARAGLADEIENLLVCYAGAAADCPRHCRQKCRLTRLATCNDAALDEFDNSSPLTWDDRFRAGTGFWQ